MSFDSIHNQLEKIVIKKVIEYGNRNGIDDKDLLADIACITLNNLPSRYIRHDVDYQFYVDDEKRMADDLMIDTAIRLAVEKPIKKRE